MNLRKGDSETHRSLGWSNRIVMLSKKLLGHPYLISVLGPNSCLPPAVLVSLSSPHSSPFVPPEDPTVQSERPFRKNSGRGKKGASGRWGIVMELKGFLQWSTCTRRFVCQSEGRVRGGKPPMSLQSKNQNNNKVLIESGRD